MSPATTLSQRQPSRKTMLYCPNCGFASRINGEWVLHITASSVEYECPNCETIIDSRRDSSDESALSTRHKGGLQFSNAD